MTIIATVGRQFGGYGIPTYDVTVKTDGVRVTVRLKNNAAGSKRQSGGSFTLRPDAAGRLGRALLVAADGMLDASIIWSEDEEK